ncbi:DNA-processing protein DprA [Solemya velum gill symbiont]|uniref:DNA-processing protein DprA n=1 Tax=Solemya velum gill symbiont TaxID=2340 RepID=UPI001E31A2CE|nr:DNA-processing protein DprA [Solemya velum gill symbiont]
MHTSQARLIHTKGAGSATLQRLVAHFGSLQTALQASPDSLNRAAGKNIADKIPRSDDPQVRHTLEWLSQPENGLLTCDSSDYPSLLRECDSPPAALFYTGDISLLKQPLLAIVGSRTPTRGGTQNAHDFSADLAARGLGIVSGLAAGIDAAAHRGALDADGITIAVTGTGPDRVYPAGNHALAVEIAARGLIITEHPPGTQAHPGHFPRRNRIIAALALGILVVEAAEKSGSLITARLGSEAGREVFAIPGSIHNALTKGTHKLIRQGAKLVENAADILEELAPLLAQARSDVNSDRIDSKADKSLPDPEYEALLDLIAHDPVSVDKLIQKTGLTAEVVSSMLLLLELNGHVESLPGNCYCRIASSPN